MKITKAEWVWLILTVIFYVAYNLPGVPAYEQPVATLIHGAVTVIPLWVITYIGMNRVYKLYKIKDTTSAQKEGK